MTTHETYSRRAGICSDAFHWVAIAGGVTELAAAVVPNQTARMVCHAVAGVAGLGAVGLLCMEAKYNLKANIARDNERVHHVSQSTEAPNACP